MSNFFGISLSSNAPVESMILSSSGVLGILDDCEPAAMMADLNPMVFLEPSL